MGFAALTTTSSLSAQQVSIADISQDVQLLSRQVGKMQLELEVMKRNNDELMRALRAQQAEQEQLVKSIRELSVSSDSRFAAQTERERQLKAELVSEITRQVKAVATETEKALQAMARSMNAQPAPVRPTVEFSDDYPKDNGIIYTVKSGDTLSKIARDLNSTVKYIQDANRISDPSRDLRVGMTIFVPQR